MEKTEIKKNILKNKYAAFFKSAITYKCGRVVLSCTLAYFAICRFILLFSYSFQIPCTILSNVYFYVVRAIFFFLLLDHNQKQVSFIK